VIPGAPNILLVNPWIHDFAAYDYWAKPMGLLYLASILREHGCNVSYMDCLDRFHPDIKKPAKTKSDGRGSYFKIPIPKPAGLEDIPRNYSRYGIPEEFFRKDLLNVPKPDVILVTSHMTYWYPGLFETIRILKENFSSTPLILGGIYATLCHDHAVNNSGADRVVSGTGEKLILELIGQFTGFSAKLKFSPKDPDTYPYPAFDLERKTTFVPVLTSRGCPFSCSYCASRFLVPDRIIRSPESVTHEIRYWHEKHKVKDFALYDDAFLADAESHAIPILEKIAESGIKIRFHTPNAIHIREITKETADLMYRSGFQTVRLGLETTHFDKRSGLDHKVSEPEFKRAVLFLKEAGFSKNQVGAYLLAGLPGQDDESIIESIKTVKESGITPIPAYYSPIPHTALWKKAVLSSRYDLEKDPVFSNNAVFPCRKQEFSWKTVEALKKTSAE
jgi:radical SAM superfamily enzyme YgiQ (UPF0313 family)